MVVTIFGCWNQREIFFFILLQNFYNVQFYIKQRIILILMFRRC